MLCRDSERYDYLLKSLEVINISNNFEQNKFHEQQLEVIILKLCSY